MENNFELYHFGVKGMKWGVRKRYGKRAVRGHGGPGVYFNRKRQLAGDRNDLDYLNKGGHLSVGLTKKRQAKYDERDRQRIENRIAKNEAKIGRSIEKRYTKAGKNAGRADYQKEQGDRAYERHGKGADLFDKAAKKYEREGSYFKAEGARRAANALRTRGENVRAERYKLADRYMKRSDKLNKKASDLATSTKVNVGKKKVDFILQEARRKGYTSAKKEEEFRREVELEERLGSDGYEMYNRIRGRK